MLLRKCCILLIRQLHCAPISLSPSVTTVTKIEFHTTTSTNDSHALRPAEGIKKDTCKTELARYNNSIGNL
jgi:hypothetical protein